MSLLVQFLIVGLGGALGAMSRFGVQHLGIFDYNKYYYTVAINLSGCLAIGVLWAVMLHTGAGIFWHLLLVVGFLGGYTTYSAFALDLMLQFQAGQPVKALVYMAITIIGGLGATALGLFVTERLLRPHPPLP